MLLINKEIEYTSLFLKSIITDHWGFPGCRYSADYMQKLESVGKSYKFTACEIISDAFDWHLSISVFMFSFLFFFFFFFTFDDVLLFS
jgi:hypothetical protein